MVFDALVPNVTNMLSDVSRPPSLKERINSGAC